MQVSFAKDALICSFLAITHTIGSSKVQERMDEYVRLTIKRIPNYFLGLRVEL